MRTTALRLAAIVATAFAASAIAQQFVYPAKGQSPDQQKKDEAAHHAHVHQGDDDDVGRQEPDRKSLEDRQG